MIPDQAAKQSAVTGGLDLDAAGRWLLKLLLVFRPSDGWLATALMLVNLMIVVWSVGEANWVDTPNLVSLVFLAMITGLVLSRIPAWGAFLLPVGIGVGGLTIVWRLVNFESRTVDLADSAELWQRLDLWVQAAKTGSINIDTVPFAFALMVATWLAGFFGVWLFARHGNFWGVFILGGAGLLSNLTYLPPRADVFLGLYLFTALMLVARVQSVRRRNQWRERNMGFDGHLGLLSISDSFFMGLVVVVVAFFFIPQGTKWQPTNDVYEYIRTPLQGWEDDFNRLFAGLPARRALGYRIWGDAMPFQGTINPTNVPVLQVESRLPMYWKARTYNTYTPKGWVSTNTSFQPLGWVPSYTNTEVYREQLEITYRVIPNYETKQLFGGGQVLAASRDVRVETYDSPLYAVDLVDPGGYDGLPPKLVEAARGLANVDAERRGTPTDSSLADGLPPQFRLVEVGREEGVATRVLIAEALPPAMDVVSVRSAEGRVKAGQGYDLTSSVSLASPAQLRQAGDDYPTWAVVKYTQLPNSLPQRVRDLAAGITATETTPYDKAKAIERHLRGMPYTLTVDPPPFNADGVDHFLFTLGEGYSEYFSSAMTVMLRSVGVPARMVTGYTTGDKVKDEEIYIVTDSNSHGWVEVFFPSYGWIPFEPTPGKILPGTFVPGPLAAAEEGLADIVDDDLDEDCLLDPETGLEDCELLTNLEPAGGVTSESFYWNDTIKDLLPWIIGALAAVVVAGGTARVLWWRFMQPSVNPNTVYRRLAFLGRLNSVAPAYHQTPFQYRRRLQEVLPNQRDNISTIIGAYVRDLYGKREISDDDRERMMRAWLNLRVPLLLNSLRRRD
jgi:transglutaminase-like putative cysteine protease